MRVTDIVLTCGGCHHWQIDFHPRALRDLDQAAITWSACEAQREHLDSGECVNPDGRIKVLDRWVDKPSLPESDTPARGVMVGEQLPAWWVWR